jgi:hypothetical protein
MYSARPGQKVVVVQSVSVVLPTWCVESGEVSLTVGEL